MRAGFEYYRAFPIDAEQNKALVNESKLQIPVLVLAGDFYPAFGGDVPGNPVLNGVKALAENVNGTVVPLSGTLDSGRATRICYKTACQFLWC